MENTEIGAVIGTYFQQYIQQQKQGKLEHYRQMNKCARKGQILFCGSSLMEQFPVSELQLSDHFPLRLYNRGVGGFTAKELLEALDICVLDREPKYLFINIGTNDMNAEDYCVTKLMQIYDRILCRIRNRLPNIKICLFAYYPVNETMGLCDPIMGPIFQHRTNERINEANQMLETLSKEHHAVLMNLNTCIADESGQLKAEYTTDGMHLSAEGYIQIWNQLAQYMRELK